MPDVISPVAVFSFLAVALATAPILAAEPVPVAPSADRPAPDPGWSLTVYDAGAVAGDTLYYRIAWSNRGTSTVRVPVDLIARLLPTADHHRGMVGVRGFVSVGEPLATPAAVDWVAVAPGEAVQQIGSLADWFDVCRGGCPEGSYDLSFAQRERHWGGLADDQREPRTTGLSWHGNLSTPTPPTRLAPIEAGPGLTVTLTRVGSLVHGRGTDMATARLRARITNRLGAPIWFPKLPALLVDWAGRSEDANGMGGAWRSGAGSLGGAWWGPADGVLLRPGQHLDIALVTDVDTSARHVWVKAWLRAESVFDPGTTRLDAPFYFGGTLATPELQVR